MGGERDLLLTSAHHVPRALPAPSPGPPSPAPLFCTLRGGASSPRGPLSPFGPASSPTLATSHLALSSPLAGFSPRQPRPLFSPLSCVSPLSPVQPGPSFPPWALFYSPEPRLQADAISGSNSEQLSNISVGREKVCACYACQPGAVGAASARAPCAGLTRARLARWGARELEFSTQRDCGAGVEEAGRGW